MAGAERSETTAYLFEPGFIKTSPVTQNIGLNVLDVAF